MAPNPHSFSPRGRPSAAQWETVVLANDTQAVAWSDGMFAGTPREVALARCVAGSHTPVTLPNGTIVTADDANPIGAFAAILLALNNNVLLIRAGTEVHAVLTDNASPSDVLLRDWENIDGDVLDYLLEDRVITVSDGTTTRTVHYDEAPLSPNDWRPPTDDDLDTLRLIGMLPDGTALPDNFLK